MQPSCARFARERTNLLRLHAMGEAYGVRPSSILGLRDPWTAFQFDEACLMAGRQWEKDLADGGPGTGSDGKRKFSTPDPRYIVKRKINERGIW